jgi:flagellar assembly protein FliH
VDQSRLDGGAGHQVLAGHGLAGHGLAGHGLASTDGRRPAIRFEPPKLASIGHGRISRSAAEVGAIAEAREQGRQDALAKLAAAIDEQHRLAVDLTAAADVLARALDQLAAADLSRIENVEHHVLQLALALAEEIVGREIRSDDDLVVTASKRALALTPDRAPVMLRVHPSDVTVVRDALGEISGHLSVVVQVMPDQSIERAGAVAEAGPLRIDAQISSTFARIREAFES